MDAPFDRGEVDRASLDATERLRARLSGRPPANEAPRRRNLLPWAFAAAMFVFVAGMVANPWFESSVRQRLPFTAAPPAPKAPDIAALQAQIARLETRDGPAAMPAERLARTEAQVETSSDQLAREADRIDRLTSDVAAVNARLAADRARGEAVAATASRAADRAEAMLVLVMARRAVEGGRAFGALDPALRHAFEARYPEAVKAVAALGTQPVTLASLRRDFAPVRAGLGGAQAMPARQSWWDMLTNTLASAVARPAGTVPLPVTEAAAAALARGDADAAAALLRPLRPRPAPVIAWLAAHDRLQAGNQALTTLETATLLPPEPDPVPEAPLPAPAEPLTP